MAQNFSVLLVEDDDPLRQILSELLRAKGWHVLSTGRGGEAVEMAKTHHVDFSILDLHLPGISGLEVFQRIANEIGPLPSIMISGGANRQETWAALQAGVFTFLPKPIAFPHLQASLDRLIKFHFQKPPGLLPPPSC